jgi:hypothetical protein
MKRGWGRKGPAEFKALGPASCGSQLAEVNQGLLSLHCGGLPLWSVRVE